MNLQTKDILALETPDFVHDWIYQNSGLKVKNVSIQSIADQKPKTFLVYEDYILKNYETVFETMNKNGINEVVIFIYHVYMFDKAFLEKIDRLSAGKKVSLICMSFAPSGLENIKTYYYDLFEHVISHDFNYLLAIKMKKKRDPVLDFMFLVNTKTEFRRKLKDALYYSGILANSFVGKNATKKFDDMDFVGKQKAILEQIDRNSSISHALNSWGILPNLEAYEKVFCDIVVESESINEYADLSEKTYRPIALGIPFVFLGSKTMYDKLLRDGYKIHDYDHFYEHWYSDNTFDEKISYLVNFLKIIKNTSSVRESMEQTARHNLNNFWVQRKLDYRTKNYEILSECFDGTAVDEIYDSLNF